LKAGKRFWFKKGQKGVGVYKRSPETLEKLKDLYRTTGNYKKKVKKK